MPLAANASVKEFKLENGLKVLIIEDHKAPLATFQIWYRVGARNESIGKTGLSHFLEHMMFKGTPKYGSKVFSNLVQRQGGMDNAFTSKDSTVYFQTLSSDRIDLSIRLEADRMRNLLLAPAEVLSERKVVMEERRMRYEDDPQNLLYESVTAEAFRSLPYRWPVIGWMNDISSLNRDDLLSHYRTFYSPDNAFIVVAGDVQPNKIMTMIKKHFGPIRPSGKGIPHRVVIEPEQREELRIILKKEAELPYVLMAYHVPSFPDNESFALEVLSNILAGGKSTRLYKSLVYEKRLVLSAFADYSGFNIDPFLFILGATAAPGKGPEEVESALNGEIERIIKGPPSAGEVQKAKNGIEAAFVFAQDSNYSKAMYAGIFEMLGGWKLYDRYLEGIRKVRPEDVQAVAVKYLGPGNRTTGILVPEKKNAK